MRIEQASMKLKTNGRRRGRHGHVLDALRWSIKKPRRWCAHGCKTHLESKLSVTWRTYPVQKCGVSCPHVARPPLLAGKCTTATCWLQAGNPLALVQPLDATGRHDLV